MKYQVKDIIREVRVALDQNMSSAPLVELGDVDTLSLEEIIHSKIVDAVRSVELAVPHHLLDSGLPFGDSIAWNGQPGQSSGYILLPDDFLRLLAFQMSDWSCAVHDAITPADPRYALQSSRFPGIRGCPQKPIVAIVNRAIGKTLEFYSCTGGKDVAIKQALYIPMPKEQLGVIYIPELIKDAVVYYAAHLVAVSTQQNEQAKALLAISNTLINNE